MVTKSIKFDKNDIYMINLCFKLIFITFYGFCNHLYTKKSKKHKIFSFVK